MGVQLSQYKSFKADDDPCGEMKADLFQENYLQQRNTGMQQYQF